MVTKGDPNYTWVTPPGATFDTCRLAPGSAEYVEVETLFHKGEKLPSGTFKILSIDVVATSNTVYDPYVAKRASLQAIRSTSVGSASFTVDAVEKVNFLTSRLTPHFRTNARGVKEMMTWHGCAVANKISILNSGLVITGGTDAFFFGLGVYSSAQAEYACRYATNEFSSDPTALISLHSSCIVLLCWTVVGNVYPITRAADYDPGQTHSNFYDATGPKALKAGLGWSMSSHHAGVSDIAHFQVPSSVTDVTYDEIAVPDGGHMLPQYVVTFERNA